MSVEVITIKAEKGGTLSRQEEQLNRAKKELSDLLKKATRVISNNILETDAEIQFIAVVDIDKPVQENGKKKTLTVKKGR